MVWTHIEDVHYQTGCSGHCLTLTIELLQSHPTFPLVPAGVWSTQYTFHSHVITVKKPELYVVCFRHLLLQFST